MPAPQRQYKDLNLNFDVHPNTKDLVFLYDEEAVKRSVKNIVLTNLYEKHFDDSFGCNILDSLFDPMSYFEAINIQSSIESSLSYYEPRIKLLSTVVDLKEDLNGYNITIKFMILNVKEPVVIQMFLERVR